MLPKMTVVLGGAASGKSAFAEGLIFADGAPRVYLATSRIWDGEMQAKVDAHLAARGPNWTTIEAPLDLIPALTQATSDQIVLLDSSTMWLSNHLLEESDLESEISSLLTALASSAARIVIVTDEVGMGVVPDNALARRFRNEQGKLNQRLAALADLAVFVTAGLPQVLKGQLP